MKKYFLLLIIPFLLQSCEAMFGKEIGIIKVNELSTKNDLRIHEITLNLKKGDEIFIWSDMNIEYKGDVKLMFQFMINKDEVYKGGLEFDPTEGNITVGESKSDIMGKTKWSFSKKNKTIIIDEGGTYTFQALLKSSENTTLKIHKAEIILKQKVE